MMAQFPHIEFIQKLKGKPRYGSFPNKYAITEQNKENRQSHSEKLQRWTEENKSNWSETIQNRESLGLAEINEEVIPIFLKISQKEIKPILELEKKIRNRAYFRKR